MLTAGINSWTQRFSTVLKISTDKTGDFRDFFFNFHIIIQIRDDIIIVGILIFIIVFSNFSNQNFMIRKVVRFRLKWINQIFLLNNWKIFLTSLNILNFILLCGRFFNYILLNVWELSDYTPIHLKTCKGLRRCAAPNLKFTHFEILWIL